MKYFTLFLFISTFTFSQSKELEEVLTFQNKLNQEYVDSLQSPLPKNERVTFKGHVFYPINTAYRVNAILKRTPDEKPFKMATTHGQPQNYIKYGEVEFSLNKKIYKLNVYQNLALIKIEAYKNNLFFPFKDITNSIETYGGGRFIDLSIPTGTTLIIDFNKAYNPYCAYTDKFSCPIVPIENTLSIEIKAGIKGPINH